MPKIESGSGGICVRASRPRDEGVPADQQAL